MLWFANVAISNAILAMLLAAVAFLVSRFTRRPALAHTLWVLVLIKLVTPPLFEVPVFFLKPVLAHQIFRAGSADRLDRHVSPVVEANAGPAFTNPTSRPAPSMTAVTVQATTAAAAMSSNTEIVSQELASPNPSTHRQTLSRKDWRARISETLLGVLPPVGSSRQLILALTLSIWGGGTVVWFVTQLWLAIRFRRLLGTATVTDSSLEAELAALAQQMGLSRWPRLQLSPGALSPMLWGVGRRALIVLPPQLIASMRQERRATLLIHELAHYRRGDHWVRLLELIATGLYWWNPVVWWARREIEVAEEQCCDAWVVDCCRGESRPYAEALLDTLDFLSTAGQVSIPAGATGLGQAPLLRRRLGTIMKGGLPKSLSPQGRALSLAVAAAILPIHATGRPPRMGAEMQLPRGKSPLASPAFAESSSALSGLLPSAELEATAPARADVVPSSAGEPAAVIWATAISPSGRYEITVRRGYHLALRDVVTNNVHDFGTHGVNCVSFAPDSATFATGGADGTVRLWDSATGRPIELVWQSDAPILSVAFSSRGQRLASGGQDGRVYVSELDRRNAHVICKVTGEVSCVRFSADERQIAVVVDMWRNSKRSDALIAGCSVGD